MKGKHTMPDGSMMDNQAMASSSMMKPAAKKAVKKSKKTAKAKKGC